jgi:RNA polymerase sigma factor (sigma-70 family)
LRAGWFTLLILISRWALFLYNGTVDITLIKCGYGGRENLMATASEQRKFKAVLSGFLRGRKAYYKTIENLIRRFVLYQRIPPSQDCDEVVAEVLAALYRNLSNEQFKGDSLKALEVYIYQMVKYTVSNNHRKLGKIQFWYDLPGYLDKPKTPFDSGLTKKDLSARILAGMDSRCREILHLKFREHWSDSELAEHFGVTKNAMSTAITRCLQKARNLEVVKNIM